MSTTTLHQYLQHYFGFTSFRPAQADIVQSLLARRDTLAILPTGGANRFATNCRRSCKTG